jgi:hypothetical protein
MPEFATSRTTRSSVPALALLAFVLLPLHAAAQVLPQLYTWKDAEGNVTIKNAPPPWYREFERTRGPRVQVLRNGKVVDDTAWPPEKRQEGRTQEAKQEAVRAKSIAAGSGKKDDDD